MSEKRLNKTSSISELLSDTMFKSIKRNKTVKNALKHSTLFSFWNMIVGKKFEGLTRPTMIRNSIIFVSAKSPVIVQELNLYKARLLEKLNSYSMPLGIEIKDIFLSYKNYITHEEEKYLEDKPQWYEKETFDSVAVEEEFQGEIKRNIDKINFLNDNQKNKLILKIFDAKKAQTLREK